MGRLVFNVTFALNLWIGVIACQAVRIYFARRIEGEDGGGRFRSERTFADYPLSAMHPLLFSLQLNKFFQRLYLFGILSYSNCIGWHVLGHDDNCRVASQ